MSGSGQQGLNWSFSPDKTFEFSQLLSEKGSLTDVVRMPSTLFGNTSMQVMVCRNFEDDACLEHWRTSASAAGTPVQDVDLHRLLGDTTGKTLVVAYDLLAPYVNAEQSEEGANLTGYLGDLWMIVETALGLSSEQVRVNGNTARYMLKHGLADVYLAATVVTTQEDILFDHTQPVVTHWYQMFVRQGAPEVSADSYVRVLSPGMWATTLSALLLLGAALRGVVVVREALGLPGGVQPAAAASLGSCFLSVVGSLCSQGWQHRPDCLSTRLTAVTALLFGYLMYNAYAAVLISYLASGLPVAPFSSLREVANKGTHSLCVRNESYAYVSLFKFKWYLSSSTRPEWNHVVNKGVCENAASADTLARAVCGHSAVALEIPSVMDVALERFPACRDQVLRVNSRKHRASASLLLRPGFPYTRAIDNVLTRCRSTGVLDRLERRYLTSSQDQHSGNTVTAGVQVSLQHIRWVLILYACFMSVPLLVLAAECATAWRARRRVHLRGPRSPRAPSQHDADRRLHRTVRTPFVGGYMPAVGMVERRTQVVGHLIPVVMRGERRTYFVGDLLLADAKGPSWGP